MSDYASPSAIKAGVDAIEQQYERFLAITRDRLDAVYPAAATGFDQLYDMRRRTIDGVLSAGRTAAHGWEDLGAMVAANQQAMMDGFRAVTQSWFGGGALDAVEATLGEMRQHMTSQAEAMRTSAAELREQQGQAMKAATEGVAGELENARQAIQGAASEAAAAKSEAVEAKSEAVEAKSEAVAAKTAAGSASDAVSALGVTVEEKIAALRGALDGEIASAVESQIETARKEIERETDEDVDGKLAALATALDRKLGKIEKALAADLAKMRQEIAGLAKAEKAAKPKKPAAAKRTAAKTTKKTGA